MNAEKEEWRVSMQSRNVPGIFREMFRKLPGFVPGQPCERVYVAQERKKKTAR